MSSNTQKNTSSFLVTILIGLIIISFMFTGYQSLSGTPDAVGSVGPYRIKVSEYQRAYNQQVNFYQQIYRDQKISKSQQENIKKTTFANLVNAKLSLILSDKIGIIPGNDEVKDLIRDQDYFKTDEKFDVLRYKATLANAGITAKDYEKEMENSVKLQGLQSLFLSYPLSTNFIKEFKKIKDLSKTVNVLKVDPSKLENHVSVSSSEVKAYLKDPNNKGKITTIFDSRKPSLSKEEQIQARHILLKVGEKKDEEVKKEIEDIHKKLTTKNFKTMANKYTQDPSGKSNGGDLGWFQRGRMVPEFEKVAFSTKPGSISAPVKTSFGYHVIYVTDKQEAKEAKLEEHQNLIAKELIQKSKIEELKKLKEKVITDAKNYLTAGDADNLSKLSSKYGLSFQRETQINPIDNFASLGLNAEIIGDIFFGKEQKKVFEKEEGLNITLVGIGKKSAKKEKEQKLEELRKEQSTQLARQLNQKMIERLKENVDISQNANIIL